MSSHTTRALLDDAFYQVLDNKIFRLLLFLVLLLVAPTFVIGFGESEVSVLYGWKVLRYSELFAFFGVPSDSVSDVQAKAVQLYQSLIVENLCGTIGMMFCIAATAFFVPSMLEKGSADILFSKPVSRFQLLMSRYFAGLLFVGILSILLTGGIYVGLLIVSGYNDPGFLWGAFTLIYLFAMLHAFSMVLGVLTRSTVAAILVSLFMFMGTGCVHSVWQFRQFSQDMELAKTLREQLNASGGDALDVPPILDDTQRSGFIAALVGTLDVLHYTLPKTKDADYLTRKLRKAVGGASSAVVDPQARLTIAQPPAGHQLVQPADPVAGENGIEVDLAREPAVWVAHDDDGRERSRVEVARRTRLQERLGGDEASGKRKQRKISASTAADEYAERVRSSAALDEEPASRKGTVDGSFAVFLDWTEPSSGRVAEKRAVVFAVGDWIVEVSASADEDWLSPAERQQRFDGFVESFALARTLPFGDPDKWYEERFDWTAELKYNAFFSIATSLAFTLAMLLLARWKLARIDF